MNAFKQVGREKLAAGAMDKLRPEQKRIKLSHLLRGRSTWGKNGKNLGKSTAEKPMVGPEGAPTIA